jgi:hypothetical protein
VQGYQGRAVEPVAARRAFVRLPDRTPQDAWPEALSALQAAASEECRLAAGADHIRDYNWSPQVSNQIWTLLLLPVYATYYLDDERAPQPVFVHGQSGAVSGSRRASVKRGQRLALILIGVAVALFLLSLL